MNIKLIVQICKDRENKWSSYRENIISYWEIMNKLRRIMQKYMINFRIIKIRHKNHLKSNLNNIYKK
jgi:hypothetical protein